MDATVFARVTRIFEQKFGKGNVDRERVQGQLDQARWFQYSAEATAIAAGGTKNALVQANGGSIFIVQTLNAAVQLNGALSSSVAGTTIPRRGDPGSDSNELPNYNQVRARITQNDVVWQKDPVPLGLMAGDGAEAFYPPTNPVFEPQSTVSVQYTNNSAVTLDVFLVFSGLWVPLGG